MGERAVKLHQTSRLRACLRAFTAAKDVWIRDYAIARSYVHARRDHVVRYSAWLALITAVGQHKQLRVSGTTLSKLVEPESRSGKPLLLARPC